MKTYIHPHSILIVFNPENTLLTGSQGGEEEEGENPPSVSIFDNGANGDTMM